MSLLDRTFQMDALKPMRELTTEEGFIVASIDVHGIEATLQACATGERLPFVPDIEQDSDEATPLDLTTASNSHRQPRGQKGISTYGRLLVRNGAFLMEKSNRVDCLSFSTCTLPPMDVLSHREVVENWAEVVRVFTQRLRRMLIASGLSGELVGVTEIQEGRLSWNSDFIGLHLHLLFVGRKHGKGWAIAPCSYQDAWRSAVESVMSNPSEAISFDRSTNMTRLKQSGAAYLGKYLSKGCKSVDRAKAANPTIKLPACWYVCTMSLRDKVKRLQVYGARPADKINSWIEDGRIDMFATLRQITYTADDGRLIPCGWAGRLSEKGRGLMGLPFTLQGNRRTARLCPEGI